MERLLSGFHGDLFGVTGWRRALFGIVCLQRLACFAQWGRATHSITLFCGRVPLLN